MSGGTGGGQSIGLDVPWRVCLGGISEESLTFPPGPCARAVGEEELERAPGKTAHWRGTPCPLGQRWGNAQSGG